MKKPLRTVHRPAENMFRGSYLALRDQKELRSLKPAEELDRVAEEGEGKVLDMVKRSLPLSRA
ncbi:hypothetical protein WME91_12580 [Sorangium sp. So ce269]